MDKYVLNDQYNPISHDCLPRDNKWLFNRPFNKDERDPWTIPKSLFAAYIDDSEELEQKCFEADWKEMKLRFNYDEEMVLYKKELYKGYLVIRTVYKQLATLGPGTGGTVWYMNANTFNEFIKKVGI